MKYNANDIARILEASDVIDALREPTAKEIYEKAKDIIELLEQILPGNIGSGFEKRITVTHTCYLYKTLYKCDYVNGHIFGFTFSLQNDTKWDGTRREKLDEKPEFEHCGGNKSNWIALLRNKDSVIEQAIAIRQKHNANKVARIQCVK